MSSTYTVRPGDTLSGIALAQLGDARRWPEIARLSGLADPDLILVGQELVLPDGDEAADATASAEASVVGAQLVLRLPPGWWVSSGYGWRQWPGVPRHHHSGVDLAVPSGTPLRAPGPGRIVGAGAAGGYGGVVDLALADGRLLRLAHCRKWVVDDGQRVTTGELLAYSGGGPGDPYQGQSTGAHLHLEVHVRGRAVDPLTQLQVQDAT